MITTLFTSICSWIIDPASTRKLFKRHTNSQKAFYIIQHISRSQKTTPHTWAILFSFLFPSPTYVMLLVEAILSILFKFLLFIFNLITLFQILYVRFHLSIFYTNLSVFFHVIKLSTKNARIINLCALLTHILFH